MAEALLEQDRVREERQQKLRDDQAQQLQTLHEDSLRASDVRADRVWHTVPPIGS